MWAFQWIYLYDYIQHYKESVLIKTTQKNSFILSHKVCVVLLQQWSENCVHVYRNKTMLCVLILYFLILLYLWVSQDSDLCHGDMFILLCSKFTAFQISLSVCLLKIILRSLESHLICPVIHCHLLTIITMLFLSATEVKLQIFVGLN